MKTEINNKEILIQAIQVYGVDSQIDMCIEECSELIKALLKFRRNLKCNSKNGKELTQNVLEEIADVEIMAEQMELIFGRMEVQKVREYKIGRLATRLKNDEEERDQA